MLLDWGAAGGRSELSVAGHVEHLLLPLLRSIGEPAALVGYCLGGTMAIARGQSGAERARRHFGEPVEFRALSGRSRAPRCRTCGAIRKAASRELGALPMEVLQAAFWSLDPERTVRKFAEFGRLEPGSAEARRFVVLEDWANEGEPLPYPAARELIEDLFGRDISGTGEWVVGGKTVTDALSVPLLNVLAGHDRIAPAATAPRRASRSASPSGHVGMIVGSARTKLHETLEDFLTPCR